VRIERLRRNYEVDVRLVHFPLHPNTPPEGMTLNDLFAGRNLDIEAMNARMKGLMASEGLPYAMRTHTYNSRMAQELAKWAESRGVAAIHDALYRAYFAESRNIARTDVLLDVARSLGLPEASARDVIEKRTFRDAVDADWRKSRQYGITGVPAFVSGGQSLTGAHPYEVLEQFVQKMGAVRRAADGVS
jgi:predicted DsbA family dithiol-disulfide isomerase